MIVYIDTSIVVRKFFSEQNQLDEWSQIQSGFASRVLLVELGRTIDRKRLTGFIDDDEVVKLHEEVLRLVPYLNIVGLDEQILRRAAEPMPIVVKTLDAIHLTTALALREQTGELLFATHDVTLAKAARAFHFHVIGA